MFLVTYGDHILDFFNKLYLIIFRFKLINFFQKQQNLKILNVWNVCVTNNTCHKV